MAWQRFIAEPCMMERLLGSDPLVWVVFKELCEEVISVITLEMPVLGPPIPEGHRWLPPRA